MTMMAASLNDCCWLWSGTRTPKGYGQAWLAGKGRPIQAHRWVYMALVGPIPKGLQLDHICRQRGCVNPAHLRTVEPRENLLAPGSRAIAAINAAKTHCPHGHAFTEDNIYRHGGRRNCWTCKRARRADELQRARNIPARPADTPREPSVPNFTGISR